MAILVRKIKSLNPKKALSIVVLAGLTAFLISSPFASANGPQFNIFPISYNGQMNTDLPMLDAKNISRGEGYSSSQADHDAGIQAGPGEIIQFSIYYHNGMPDADENAALNTIVSAFAQPSLGTPAMTHTISASIGAQNASTVTSDSLSRGGNVNVYIQGSLPQSLSLVPGSVFVYKDQGTSNPPGAVQMPDTIFNGGVNIGTVRGCFQYHGFANFKLQVSQNQPPQEGTLGVQKQVRNITAGSGSVFQRQVNANPGDTVEYTITVSASNNPVSNVSIRDVLDSRLNLLGLLTLDFTPVDSSAFFGSGLSIGTVTPGNNRVLRFQATVAGASQFGTGTVTLPNTATAFNSLVSVSDTANVVVSIQPRIVTCSYTWDPPLVADGSGRALRRVSEPANVRMQISGLLAFQTFSQVNQHSSGNPIVKATRSADGQGNFTVNKDTSIITSVYVPGYYSSFIEVNGQNVAACTGFRIEPPVVQKIGVTKTVRNDTTTTIFQDQVDAQPSNQVTFQIIISPQNSNTTLQNVVLTDTLPGKLNFVPGSLNVNGAPQSSEGGLFTSGLNLGTIAPNQTVTVLFQATVAGAGNFVVGSCETLGNAATVTASGNLNASDTASVLVCKQTPQKPPGSPGQRPL